MNIKFIDNLTFDVYLNKKNIQDIDLTSNEKISKYLKIIINKLKKRYDMKIEGFYDVNIFIDKYYGIIINFKKEKIDYYDYFNGVDMNINVKESTFLYEVDDIPLDLLNKLEIVKKSNSVYIKIKSKLKEKDFMNLIEHTEKIVKM